MTRKDVLDQALICVNGDREEDYGTPERNFSLIANLWNDYIHRGGDSVTEITPTDVAAMLALLKIARIASGKSKKDNWIDLAGYAACGGELNCPDNAEQVTYYADGKPVLVETIMEQTKTNRITHTNEHTTIMS